MSFSKNVLSSPKGVVSLGAFLLVGAGVLQPGLSTSPDPGIRFVDVKEVIQSAKVFRDGLARIKAYGDKKNAELKALKDEIKKKRALRQTLNPETAEFDQATMEIAFLEDRGKIIQEMAKNWMGRENVKIQNYVYNLLRRAVAEYARANHLKGVLAVNEFQPRKKNSDPPRVVLQDNFLRNVLWADPAFNITPEIIKMINR